MDKANPVDGGLWTPSGPRLDLRVDDVVADYELLLECVYRPQLEIFRRRKNADSEAAMAEAVVFNVLHSQQLNPVPCDLIGFGGPDFHCRSSSGHEFAVEATHLDRASVVERTGWLDQLDAGGFWASDGTLKVMSATGAKAKQLGGLDVPAVLAVCLAHCSAAEQLGVLAAELAMGAVANEVESRGGVYCSDVVAPSRAIFTAVAEDGTVSAIRQSISAVLLISIWENHVDVVGLLHPDPVRPLDYRVFAGIPCLRAEWPALGNGLRTEWVVARPAPRSCWYSSVTPTDAQLKQAAQQPPH